MSGAGGAQMRAALLAEIGALAGA